MLLQTLVLVAFTALATPLVLLTFRLRRLERRFSGETFLVRFLEMMPQLVTTFAMVQAQKTPPSRGGIVSLPRRDPPIEPHDGAIYLYLSELLADPRVEAVRAELLEKKREAQGAPPVNPTPAN